MTNPDVVVIGAGIVGAACAKELASAGLAVAVVDQFEGPALGSTAVSFACVRVQWSDATNIELSWSSIREYEGFEELFGESAGYRAIGYLLLVPSADWDRHLAGVELQRASGAPVEIIDLDRAAEFVEFDGDGLAGATFGPRDGVVDPDRITHTLMRCARSLGATTHFGSPIIAIEPAASAWRIETTQTTLHTSTVVNASGAWAAEVAALAGFDLPVVPSRRTIYSSAALADRQGTPMVIDVGTGFYLRSEGPRILFGLSNPNEIDGFQTSMDWEWLDTAVPVGCRRFPWLADVPLDQRGSWFGHYELTPDNAAIIGAMPDRSTWVNACGFSGHGVMQAPAVGRVIAEEIVLGRARSIDIDPLRIERFDRPSAPRERHVY